VGGDGSTEGGAASQAEIDEPPMGQQPSAEGEREKKRRAMTRGKSVKASSMRQKEAAGRRGDEAAAADGGPVENEENVTSSGPQENSSSRRSEERQATQEQQRRNAEIGDSRPERRRECSVQSAACGKSERLGRNMRKRSGHTQRTGGEVN